MLLTANLQRIHSLVGKPPSKRVGLLEKWVDVCSRTILKPVSSRLQKRKYEGRLISNAHGEISRKRDHVFKQKKVGSKVQYFSYKLTYLFFDIVALSFSTFFPT